MTRMSLEQILKKVESLELALNETVGDLFDDPHAVIGIDDLISDFKVFH